MVGVLSRTGLLASMSSVLVCLYSLVTVLSLGALITFVLLMTMSRLGRTRLVRLWVLDLSTVWCTWLCLVGACVVVSWYWHLCCRLLTRVWRCLDMPLRSPVTATVPALTSLVSLLSVWMDRARLSMDFSLRWALYVWVMVCTAAAPLALVGLTSVSVVRGPLSRHVVVPVRLLSSWPLLVCTDRTSWAFLLGF